MKLTAPDCLYKRTRFCARSSLVPQLAKLHAIIAATPQAANWNPAFRQAVTYCYSNLVGGYVATHVGGPVRGSCLLCLSTLNTTINEYFQRNAASLPHHKRTVCHQGPRGVQCLHSTSVAFVWLYNGLDMSRMTVQHMLYYVTVTASQGVM